MKKKRLLENWKEKWWNQNPNRLVCQYLLAQCSKGHFVPTSDNCSRAQVWIDQAKISAIEPAYLVNNALIYKVFNPTINSLQPTNGR